MTVNSASSSQPDCSSGFTLIELSIVLVIIGLIVGGVLAGQNLINTAAVRAQITQIEKYNTAVNTFRGKYGGLPGDLPLNLANQFGFAVPSSCTGLQGGRDGNGLIDGYVGTQKLAAFMGENALFWSDLGTANLVDEGGGLNGVSVWPGLCTASYTTPTLDGFLPPGKIGYNTRVHVYETNGYNWYLLANIALFSGGTSIVSATPSIPVSSAYNIDKKMDDGIPTTGNVVAVYINGSQTSTTPAPNASADSATTCYNTATASGAYSIAYGNGTGANCALSFRFQ